MTRSSKFEKVTVETLLSFILKRVLSQWKFLIMETKETFLAVTTDTYIVIQLQLFCSFTHFQCQWAAGF